MVIEASRKKAAPLDKRLSLSKIRVPSVQPESDVMGDVLVVQEISRQVGLYVESYRPVC